MLETSNSQKKKEAYESSLTFVGWLVCLKQNVYKMAVPLQQQQQQQLPSVISSSLMNQRTSIATNNHVSRCKLLYAIVMGCFFTLFLGINYWMLGVFQEIQNTNTIVVAAAIPYTPSTTTTTTTDFNNNNKKAAASNASNASAAACLLVMDDNHRLVEWLAYHHFTTNLRYLIVAVDPRSTTQNPSYILDRYNNRITVQQQQQQQQQLQYEIVGDDDFMGNRMLDKRQQMINLTRKHLTQIHRVRQKAFYQYCLQRLDVQWGIKTWTLLIDVDEYLVVVDNNNNNNNVSKTVDHAHSTKPLIWNADQHYEIMSTPGGILKYLQTTAQKATALEATSSVAAAAAAAQYKQFQSPCVSIPRWLFGTQQDSYDSSMSSSFSKASIILRDKNNHNDNHIDNNMPPLPQELVQQLDTMRWFYHADATDFDRNGLGKTIVDLKRIDIPKSQQQSSFFSHPVNPHRPFQDYCRDPKRIRDLNHNTLVRIHHYVGTWETYSFRNDSRKGAERSREAWEFRATHSGSSVGGKCTDIVPWLEGFLKYYGHATAMQLLEGAGLPPDTTKSPKDNEEWKFLFVDEYISKKKKKNDPQYDSNYGQFLRNRTAYKIKER